jgi:transposase
MRKYIRIGVDIAKNCFQVHALESEDCSATKRRLSRSGIVKFLAEVEPCAIGMEACGSAHYWARRFRAMGHEVKLTPPIYVKPYVKRGKNDAADAAAICEAMSRPNMRFVAVKSEDQQATLMAHKTRELLIKQRTMSVNALRGHLAEFGVIAAKGISHVEELVERAAAADLPAMVQATLGVLLAQLRSLDAAIDELERAIVADHRRDTEGRQPFTAEIKTLAKGPSTYDPLLARPALVVEGDDILGGPSHVGDNKARRAGRDRPDAIRPWRRHGGILSSFRPDR